MPETKRPLKAILSPVHSDADAVCALFDLLTDGGVETWLDKENTLW